MDARVRSAVVSEMKIFLGHMQESIRADMSMNQWINDSLKRYEQEQRA